MTEPVNALARRPARVLTRLGGWLRREQVPVAIVLSGFVGRLMVAGWNSYWYDEVLSVWWFGVRHATLASALRLFAENSIHPPLYQSVLYFWMRLFGDSEVATRTLSNLYVTVATLVLYSLVRRHWGKGVAIFTMVAFSVMNVPIFFALETRSYAQTLMLATVSSYCFLVVVERLGAGPGRRLLRQPAVWGLLTANTGLFFTHYYNAFFVVAQALIAAVYLLWRFPPRRWPAVLGAAALFYAIPPGLLFLLWGRVMIESIERFSGPYEVTSPEDLTNPLQLLRTSVIEPNLVSSSIAGIAALVVVALLFVSALGRLVSSRRDRSASGPWAEIYLVGWMVLPLLVAHLGFIVAGVARYQPRYFIFSVPPLVPLVLLSSRRATLHLSSRLGGERLFRAAWGVIALVFVLALLPAGYQAAASVKYGHDWRGIVRRVGDVIRADEAHRYVIFEATTGMRRLTDYYFERLGPQLAVDTISRNEERLHEYRLINEYGSLVEEHDFLIVVFPHTSTREFPGLLEELASRYTVHHRQLDPGGRGFIIYDVRSDS